MILILVLHSDSNSKTGLGYLQGKRSLKSVILSNVFSDYGSPVIYKAPQACFLPTTHNCVTCEHSSYLTFLCLDFLICKARMAIAFNTSDSDRCEASASHFR